MGVHGPQILSNLLRLGYYRHYTGNCIRPTRTCAPTRRPHLALNMLKTCALETPELQPHLLIDQIDLLAIITGCTLAAVNFHFP